MGIMDVVEQASITSAINEGWIVMSAITAVALAVLFVMGPILVPVAGSPRGPSDKNILIEKMVNDLTVPGLPGFSTGGPANNRTAT